MSADLIVAWLAFTGDDTEPTAAPEAKAPSLADSVPSGTWKLVTVTTKSNNTQRPQGVKERYTWTMTPECEDDKACTVKVKSSSGNDFSLTWDGTTLTREGPASAEHRTSRCG